MKPKNVSVSVSDFNGELFVQVTFRLPGEGFSLRTETAYPDPPNGDTAVFGKRIEESSRRHKAKEIREIIEAMDFTES